MRSNLRLSRSSTQTILNSTSNSTSASVSGSGRRWISSSPSSSSSSSSSSIRAALLLSRPPTILREPTRFEADYFKYNQKLKFNLSQPFPKDFYFKKGSSAEARFLLEEQQRKTELASGLDSQNGTEQTKTKGRGTGKAKGGDEIEQQDQQAGTNSNPDQDLYKTLERETEADHKNDLQSLKRKLDSNLWLFVRETKGEGKTNSWRLPSKEIGRDGEKELLHKAAPSALTSILGTEMDLWLISNLPVGLVEKGKGVDEKTYILPAHILSGSPSKALAEKNGVEFQWLTKSEAYERISQSDSDGGREYWERIEGLLD